MKTVSLTRYECGLCGKQYESQGGALKCESRQISQDKGAKIGDRVRVLSGDGRGEIATVTNGAVIDMSWGHYAWERYWHTVSVTAQLSSGAYRLLTFDDYELLPQI